MIAKYGYALADPKSRAVPCFGLILQKNADTISSQNHAKTQNTCRGVVGTCGDAFATPPVQLSQGSANLSRCLQAHFMVEPVDRDTAGMTNVLGGRPFRRENTKISGIAERSRRRECCQRRRLPLRRSQPAANDHNAVKPQLPKMHMPEPQARLWNAHC